MFTVARIAIVLSFAIFASISYAEVPTTEVPVTPPFDQREHVVQRMNAERMPDAWPAEIQWISEPWFKAEGASANTQMPYLAYMPEKGRLLMLVESLQPIKTALIHSDDGGKTWSDRRWLRTDEEGNPNAVALGLTYLGGGKLMAYPENAAHGRWLSDDYGQTWRQIEVKDSSDKRYIWDPLLPLRDENGNVTKVLEASWRPTGIAWGSPDGDYSQGYFRSSIDGGRTWTEEVKVPQWRGVNEASMIRAANGDIIAACRTDYPKRFAHHALDHFGGLAVSRSSNEGKTWSDLEPLYEWGRHHPSMVLLPDGRIVMTYVIRLGYSATWDGYPRFGIEAVVSNDHGKTWDMDHRYILAEWQGNITGAKAMYCSPQSTSTVLLPDGTLVTAFGTGFRNQPNPPAWKMDVAIVRWTLQAPKPIPATKPGD